MKNKSKVLFLGSIFLIVTVIVLMVTISGQKVTDSGFVCHARVYTKLVSNACYKSSMLDVVLSMQKGEGELMVSGTHTCPRTPLASLQGSVRYTYVREGNYYRLHLQPRSPEMVELFEVLKEDNIKLKITPLNSNDYMIETPLKTVFLCTVE
ncbi:hypothetical protein AB1287_00915 [Enterobacter asburiae]|uniref:hypothetical protein n=1 Tax=Scandinavium sp. UTDF21-P1B TaxID=3446379 RepID=UPI003473AB29